MATAQPKSSSLLTKQPINDAKTPTATPPPPTAQSKSQVGAPAPQNVQIASVPECSMKKASSVRLAETAEKVVKVSPYEKVTPRIFDNDETWKEEANGETLEHVGLRRWIPKKTGKRRTTALKIGLIYGSIILVVLVAVSVGLYFMVSSRKQKTKSQSQLDSRLTTRTQMCRAHSAAKNKKSCVFEDAGIDDDHQDYKACGKECTSLHVKFSAAPNSEPRFEMVSGEPFFLDNVDFADCGAFQWCKGDKCENSGIQDSSSWWTAGTGDEEPFEQGHGVWLKTDDVRCVTTDDTSSKEMYEQFVELSKCDEKACTDGVAASIRIQFYECDLEMDPNAGLRKAACADGRNFFRLIKCQDCGGYDAKKREDLAGRLVKEKCNDKPPTADLKDEKCVYKCEDESKTTVFMPNGTSCGVNSFCAAGFCYAAMEAPEQIEEAEDYT